MNRAQRRALAARADAAAGRLAASAYDRGANGRLRHVADPRAQRVLRRAFREGLRDGGRPRVIEVGAREAGAFPEPGEGSPGGRWFLAAGFDRDGRATFLLRPVAVAGARDAETERRVIEGCLLAELRGLLAETWADLPDAAP